MLDLKALCQYIILLCAVCVLPHFGASIMYVRADVGSEGAISGVDQSETIKQLREENAKLKRALWDAEVENANLRTEINVHEHRKKVDSTPLFLSESFFQQATLSNRNPVPRSRGSKC